MMSDNGTTKLSAWRAKAQAGEIIELPSGHVVKLRRMHVLALVEQGGIPAPLAGLASELVSGNKEKLTPTDMERYIEIVNRIVCAAFVEPRVVLGDGDEESLGVAEIEMTDRLAVYNWSQLPGGRLKKFRPEQA